MRVLFCYIERTFTRILMEIDSESSLDPSSIKKER